MVRVCEDWFPNPKNPKKSGFYMNKTLKENIDALLKNASKKADWDFVGIISGRGQVRVGKSVLAMQIACYWIYMLEKLYGVKVPFSIKENIIFHGVELIRKGNKVGVKYPHSALIFDEAGADLESTKVMRRTTQAVKDFLRECGQYNMLTLLVLPDFFDLPKGIAISRSDFLIDCYALTDEKGIFRRGFYNAYNRKTKKHLYLKGKKFLDYDAHHWDFQGDYFEFYPFCEEEYRETKVKALKTRAELSIKELRMRAVIEGLTKHLKGLGYANTKMTEVVKKETGFRVSEIYFRRILKRSKEEEEDDEETGEEYTET